ncbi:MAG: glycosyltransferase, partial [Acidimicrobiales bacterium]
MNAQKIVVATPDRLGTRMAGPAIRACRIARALASAGHDVSLVSTSPTSEVIALDGVDVLVVPPRIEGFDVAVIQGRILVDHPELGKSSTRLVMDLYDPFHLEVMHLGNEHQLLRSDHVEGALQTLSDQIARGDFFMCASERQRDMWLGYLAAGGRINPAIHDLDPTFRSLIDVVPFGVDDGLAQRDGTPLRDAHGFSSDDVVVGWTGGLHHWLDPMLVLDAFAIASVRCPRLKAVFLGGAHPGTGMLSPRAQAIADLV